MSTLINFLPSIKNDKLLVPSRICFSAYTLQERALSVIQILAQYNMSSQELKNYFRLIKTATQGKNYPLVMTLLGTLKDLGAKSNTPGSLILCSELTLLGPVHVFDFNGAPTCGIALPPFKFTNSGYTLSFWFRLEREEFLLNRPVQAQARLMTYNSHSYLCIYLLVAC